MPGNKNMMPVKYDLILLSYTCCDLGRMSCQFIAMLLCTVCVRIARSGGGCQEAWLGCTRRREDILISQGRLGARTGARQVWGLGTRSTDVFLKRGL